MYAYMHGVGGWMHVCIYVFLNFWLYSFYYKISLHATVHITGTVFFLDIIIQVILSNCYWFPMQHTCS